jgi:adenosine deaminase
MSRIDRDVLVTAPKVLLHDHLDGGLRPSTVIELAHEYGYKNLPTHDVDELALWFNRGAKRNDLVLYLETFAHTVGVMQHRDAIERVAFECAQDLAADGVVAQVARRGEAAGDRKVLRRVLGRRQEGGRRQDRVASQLCLEARAGLRGHWRKRRQGEHGNQRGGHGCEQGRVRNDRTGDGAVCKVRVHRELHVVLLD